MNRLLFIIFVLLTSQAVLGGGEPVASDKMLEIALANPQRYRIDDGGNIDFGNGMYKRRFSFSGKAQACHSGNYIYAGSSRKCVKPVYNSDGDETGCNSYANVELKTIMVGTRKICVSSEENLSDACTKYSTVKVNRGPRVKVAVFEIASMSSKKSDAGLIGYNYLTLPSCN